MFLDGISFALFLQGIWIIFGFLLQIGKYGNIARNRSMWYPSHRSNSYFDKQMISQNVQTNRHRPNKNGFIKFKQDLVNMFGHHAYQSELRRDVERFGERYDRDFESPLMACQK